MRTLFFLLCCAAPSIVSGREIRVNVSDDRQALAYAQVFVNGDFITLTDSEGRASIPLEQLEIGDTIRSKYVGLLPVFRIFDAKMERQGVCSLHHGEMEIHQLEPATAISYSLKGSRKIFRREVDTHRQLMANCTVTGHFSGSIRLSDRSTRVVEGTFVLKNAVPSGTSRQDFPRFYFGTPAEVTISGDTTRVSSELRNSLRQVFRNGCGIIGEMYREQMLDQPNSILFYLGESDGKRHFRYTSRYVAGSRAGIQILFDSDVKTRRMETFQYSEVIPGDDRYDLFEVDLVSRRIQISHARKARQGTIDIPKSISAHIQRRNGTITELKVDRIAIDFGRNIEVRYE